MVPNPAAWPPKFPKFIIVALAWAALTVANCYLAYFSKFR